MASNQDFVDYVCDQIRCAGEISYRKMFGEYGIYCNEKIIGLICNNMFYVKKTNGGALLIPNCVEESPYTNAKPHFLIEDIDNSNRITELIMVTYNELPKRKAKKVK